MDQPERGVPAARSGRFNYFVTGDYLQNSVGITPATSRRHAHPRRHQAGPRLRLPRVPPRPHEQGQRDLRHLRRPLPDPERPGARSRVHRQRHLGLRLREGQRDPARAELLRRPVLSQGRAGSDACHVDASPATAPSASARTRWPTSSSTASPRSTPQQHRDRTPGRGQLRPRRRPIRCAGRDHLRRGTERPDDLVGPADGSMASRARIRPSTSSRAPARSATPTASISRTSGRMLPTVTINGGLRFDYSHAFRDE